MPEQYENLVPGAIPDDDFPAPGGSGTVVAGSAERGTMGPLASVEHVRLDDVVVVRVRGEIDVSNGDEIFASALEAVTSDTSRVVVDLSEVEYFDSVGVRLVFELQRRLSSQGMTLAVARNHQSYVRKILALCGAEEVLPVFDDVETAARP